MFQTTGSFEFEWQIVSPRVKAYCLRFMENSQDAEDVFQQIAVRVWRGFAAFRGDAPFLGWVMIIARKECWRFISQKNKRRLRETPITQLSETADQIESFEQLKDGGTGLNILSINLMAETIEKAVEQQILTEIEGKVLIARLRNSDLNWTEIGEILQVDGGTCAVTHCRAVPKLRVYLFITHSILLGGQKVIVEAYRILRSDNITLLSKNEIQAFEMAVLRPNNRQTINPAALRGACSKVIKYIAQLL